MYIQRYLYVYDNKDFFYSFVFINTRKTMTPNNLFNHHSPNPLLPSPPAKEIGKYTTGRKSSISIKKKPAVFIVYSS